MRNPADVAGGSLLARRYTIQRQPAVQLPNPVQPASSPQPTKPQTSSCKCLTYPTTLHPHPTVTSPRFFAFCEVCLLWTCSILLTDSACVFRFNRCAPTSSSFHLYNSNTTGVCSCSSVLTNFLLRPCFVSGELRLKPKPQMLICPRPCQFCC